MKYLFLVLVVMLSACSKSDETAQASASSNQINQADAWEAWMTVEEKEASEKCPASANCRNYNPLQGELADHAMEKAKVRMAYANLPKGDVNTPDVQFVDMKEPSQLMSLYYAMATSPVIYEDIAKEYSEKYKRERDTFKMQDILKEITPKYEEEINSAKSSRYWRTTIVLRLAPYDAVNKAFNSKNDVLSRTAFRSSSDAWGRGGSYSQGYVLTNIEKYNSIVVADESVARKIEALRTTTIFITAELYMYAQNAENNTVRMQVLKMKVTDKKGNELLTIYQ